MDAASDTLPAISTLVRDKAEPSWALQVKADPFDEGSWISLRQRAGVSIADALVGSGLVNDDSVKVEFNGVEIPADKRHMVRPKENRAVTAEPTPGGPGTFVASLINIAFYMAGAPGVFMAIVAVAGSIYDYKLQQKNRPNDTRQGTRIDATGSNNADKGGPLPIIAGYIKFTPPLAMLPSNEYIGESADQYFKTAVFWGHGPMTVDNIHFGTGDGANDIKPESEIIDSGDEWVRHDFEGKGNIVRVDRVDETRVNITPSSTEYIYETETQTERMRVEIYGELQWYIEYLEDVRDSGTQIWDRRNGSIRRTVKIQYRKKPEPGETLPWIDVADLSYSNTTIRSASPSRVYIDGGEDPANKGERLALPNGRTIYQIRITGTYSETSPGDPSNYWNGREYKRDTLRVHRVFSEADEAPVSVAGVAVSAYKIKLPSTESRVVREINAVGGSWVFKGEKTGNEVVWPDFTDANRRDRSKFHHSTNPADWFIAYITSPDFNRFPKSRNTIDFDSLAEWWLFCDERGLKWSLRNHAGLTLNDLLNDVCAAGLAQPVLTGKWGVVIDRAVPRSSWLFTPGNTADFLLQNDRIDVPHGLRVAYEDEDRDWEEQSRVIYRDGFSLDGSGSDERATHIEDHTFRGVTNGDQVFILARHRLAALIHRPHLVTLNVDYAAMAVELGDRVTLAHDQVATGLGWGDVADVRNEASSPVAGPPQYAAWPSPGGFSSQAPSISNFTTLAAPSNAVIGRFSAGATDAPLNWRYDGAYATWVDGNTQHVIAAFGDNGAAYRTRTRGNSNVAWNTVAWSAWTRASSSSGAPYFEIDADRVAGDSRRPALVRFGVTTNMPAIIKPRSHVTIDRTYAILEDLPEGQPTSSQRVHQAFWGARTWERRVTRSAGQRGALIDLADFVTFEAGKTYSLVVGLENGENVTLEATAPANLPNGVGSTKTVRVARGSGVKAGNPYSFIVTRADYKVAAIEPYEEGRATLTLVNYGGDAVFKSADTIPPYTPVVHRPASPTLTGPLPPILDESAIISDEDALPVDLKGTPTPTILVPFEIPADDPQNPKITGTDRVTVTAVPVSGATGLTPRPSTVPASEGRAYLEPVTAGVTYDIQAESFDTDSGFSRKATARHTAVGLAARPPSVIDFDMEVAGDTTNFTWEFPPDLPRDAVAAEIRYATDPDTANWDEMSVVARVSIENTAKTLPTVNGAYAIKLVDSVGSYSETPFIRRMRLANPPVPLNVVATAQEHTAWSGTKSGVVVRNNTLELERVTQAAIAAPKIGNVADPDVPDFDTIGEVNRIGSQEGFTRFRDRGSYEGAVTDLGAVYDVVLEVERKVSPPVNLSLLLKDIEGWADLSTMSGTPGDDATQVRVQIRTATEDPVADPGKWTGWHDVTRQRVTARWVQARVTMITVDTNISPVIEEMTLKVSAVQEVLRGSATSAAGNKDVAFSPAFEDDDVKVVLQLGNDAQPGDYAVLESSSKGKFTFSVRNSSGTKIAGRSVTWLAVGWGKRGD